MIRFLGGSGRKAVGWLAVLVAVGCASAEKESEVIVVPNQVKSVTIAPLGETRFEWPIATLVEFGREVEFSDGSTSREVGYRAWDLNGDGRPDVVSVLDGSGKVKHTAIDLDFDGSPDRYK